MKKFTSEEQIKAEFTAMKNGAIKLIDKGEDAADFMFIISNAAAEMAGGNLRYAGIITREAKAVIKKLAEYKKT